MIMNKISIFFFFFPSLISGIYSSVPKMYLHCGYLGFISWLGFDMNVGIKSKSHMKYCLNFILQHLSEARIWRWMLKRAGLSPRLEVAWMQDLHSIQGSATRLLLPWFWQLYLLYILYILTTGETKSNGDFVLVISVY